MVSIQASLRVLFDPPFWIGLYEREEDGQLTVSRTVFGAEPTDPEVYHWILGCFTALRFSPAVGKRMRTERRNPKRERREAHACALSGVGTKSQQALSLLREQDKQARQTRSRAADAAEKERQFALRQQKRREKHRGH